MAWIESHQALGAHPKTKRLARALDEDLVATVGRLQFLWWWALDYAQDGYLQRFDKYDVADAARWGGDPDVFLDALKSAGFLDEDMYLHDWHEYAGRLIKQREGNKERKRMSRARHAPVTRPSQDGVSKVDVTSGGVTGLPTNLTNQDKDHDHLTMIDPASTEDQQEDQIDLQLHVETAPIRKTDGYTDDFVAFWDVYPRHISKRDAFKKWQARIKEGVAASQLIHAAVRYAVECKKNQTEMRFIKHPSTFLGSNKHYEDYMRDEDKTERSPKQQIQEETENDRIHDEMMKQRWADFYASRGIEPE